MLDAARQLFEEVGYEAATIRDIARRAGVSVGSVFTGFSSKAHVLGEVIRGRREELYADLERVAPHLRGTTADRVRSLFAVHYAFEFRRLKLFLAYISVAFEWREARQSTDLPVLGTNPRLIGMIRDCLAEGVARGDVSPELDLDQAVDLLLGAYVWNYRLAAGDGADSERLVARFDHQIGVLFDGFRPAS